MGDRLNCLIIRTIAQTGFKDMSLDLKKTTDGSVSYFCFAFTSGSADKGA